MEVPLAADHFGHIGVNSCIRLGKALEKYNMAWLEDMIPWQYTDLLKQITSAINVPTLTGEDIYCLAGFKELIDYLIKSVGSEFGRSIFTKEFQAQKAVSGSGHIS